MKPGSAQKRRPRCAPWSSGCGASRKPRSLPPQQNVDGTGSSIHWARRAEGEHRIRALQECVDRILEDGTTMARAQSLPVHDAHAACAGAKHAFQECAQRFLCLRHGKPMQIELCLDAVLPAAELAQLRILHTRAT